MFKKIKVNKAKKEEITLYVVLRFLVILTLIVQFLRGNYENVFMCFLTLILFTFPILIDKKLNIALPNMLESIIFLFIFSAEILGEVQNFYGIFPYWDTLLHTLNGFLCAALGFSLIDILNRTEKFHLKLTPVFVTLVAFCFSMTVGILWEFFEYGMDSVFSKDTQKDTLITDISSVYLNPEFKNTGYIINDITQTVIYSLDNDGNEIITVIEGGYLDVGINDTMKDLIVNFIGAVVFSIIGLLYIKDRDNYKFAENFIPTLKSNQ